MPEGTDALTLAAVLTAGGATAAAAFIATFIQFVVKKLPVIGAWVDADHEPSVVVLLAGVLVAWAYVATAAAIDSVGVFAALLAWVGIAQLATAGYDTARTVQAKIAGSSG